MVQQGSFAFKKRCGNAPTRRVVICRVEEVLTGGRGLGCKSDFFLLHELLWGKNAVLISLFPQPKYVWELRSQMFPQEITPGSGASLGWVSPGAGTQGVTPPDPPP